MRRHIGFLILTCIALCSSLLGTTVRAESGTASPGATVPTRKPPPALPRGTSTDLVSLEARALGGDAAAQLELAERLAAGEARGTSDMARALAWYERAAEGGEADASWALADLFRNGLDVPLNLDKAVFWYLRAAEQGHAEAMYDLGLLHADGTIIERDPAQAVQWFEQAADAGIARALFMLGTLYEQGVDGAPDLELARAWYARAADAGDATGKAALDRLASGQRNVEVAATPEGALTAAPRTVDAPPSRRQVAQPVTTSKSPRPVPVNREGVHEIQTRLTAAGFKVGRPDGHLGKRTAAAIRAYQKQHGLPVDGRATQALLQHLRGADRDKS